MAEKDSKFPTVVSFEDQVVLRLEQLCLDFMITLQKFKTFEIRLLSTVIDRNQIFLLPEWLKKLAESKVESSDSSESSDDHDKNEAKIKELE